MASDQERMETLVGRLTPGVREAIDKAIALDRVPTPLREVIGAPARRLMGLQPSGFESREGAASTELADLPISGMEAIVQRFGRPPLLIRDDRVVLEDLPDFPPGTDALIRETEPRIPSVGRIEFVNYQMAWGGTGWVVGEAAGGGKFVVTNRHVAALVAMRKADGAAIFMRSPAGQRYGAKVNFLAEAGATEVARTVELKEVFYLADDSSADIALLRVAADGDLPQPLVLDEKPVRKRDVVAIIGYPAFDSRNNADDQARYFRDLYEVKRFAPGFISQDLEGAASLSHDCTTLGGNSGSPLIRLDGANVIGLHFSGIYGKNNSAVAAATIAALLRGERPVSVRVAESAPTEGLADGNHPPEYFEGRTGFDTAFLGSSLLTPWPRLPAGLVGGLAAPSDNPPEPNELRYTHFGVKYSARLKAPAVTAVNIDGKRAVRIKRTPDRWFTDGRIAKAAQLGSANFKDPQIDRGHQVRREDPNWGEDAELANSDTFHYVNAAAQHSALNQGKTLWQGLENYILDSARTQGFKACVFTGPVFRGPNDVDEIIIDGAVAPLEFWKVVVTLNETGDGLHATAYLLSQGELIRKLVEDRSRREGAEGFTLGAYRTFQIAVRDLAAATGYDFSAYAAADPLAKSPAGAEAIEAGEPLFLPLDQWDDIRL